MHLETEYHPEHHNVTTKCNWPMRRLFQKTSTTIIDALSPENYARVCRELGETGPSDIARGARLLRNLGSSRSITATGEEFNYALSLVSWIIVLLVDLKRPLGVLPVALTGLAYIAPIRLPELDLPEASEIWGRQSDSPTWRAYEEIRSVECRNLGAIPAVASAHRLWQELQDMPSTNESFRQFVGILETSSMTYRRALQALAKLNSEESNNGGQR